MPHTPALDTVGRRRRPPQHDPLVGTLLDDRFLIEARIATGGFGAIYRARTADGEPVALKILHPQLTGDPTMVARFRREGATLTQLHDPHTVTTFAVGETRGGTLYIAMELLSGESLHERLHRDGALPWQAAVAITRAVCSSLAEAHALGVVHRDLKPENIHVEPRGDGADVVKVIDFGIARIVRGSSIDDGKELTCAGYMIGTYDYMSPEQIIGSPCDARSDIYALGVVTYELLTGRRPFPQVTGPASMMTALLTQTPAPPSIFAAIPPELDRIVMRCLEREPEDRFHDILELAGALDRLARSRRPPREDVTLECPAADPGATLGDDERTWIDHDVATIPGVDRSGVTGEWALPWALPKVDAHGAVPTARPARRLATGTGPVTARAPALGAPRAIMVPRCAYPDVLYTTLPGIAVATRPCTTHGAGPGPAGRPTTPPLGPPAVQVPGIATPSSPPPAMPPAMPPAQLASGSGPELPARSYGRRWLALVVLCTAAIVLLAAI